MWLSDGGQDYFKRVDSDTVPAVDTLIQGSSFPTPLSPFQTKKLQQSAVAQLALADLSTEASRMSGLSPSHSEVHVFSSLGVHDDGGLLDQSTPVLGEPIDSKFSENPSVVRSPELTDAENTVELMRSLSRSSQGGSGALLLSSYGIVNPRTLRLSDPSLGLQLPEHTSYSSSSTFVEHVTTGVEPDKVLWKRTSAGIDIAELPVPPALSPPEIPAKLFTTPAIHSSSVQRTLYAEPSDADVPQVTSGRRMSEPDAVLLWECFGQPGTVVPGDLPKQIRKVLCSLPHAEDNGRHRSRVARLSDSRYQPQLVTFMKRGARVTPVITLCCVIVSAHAHRKHLDKVREGVSTSQTVEGCLAIVAR